MHGGRRLERPVRLAAARRAFESVPHPQAPRCPCTHTHAPRFHPFAPSTSKAHQVLHEAAVGVLDRLADRVGVGRGAVQREAGAHQQCERDGAAQVLLAARRLRLEAVERPQDLVERQLMCGEPGG